MVRKYEICSRCIMDTTDPDIWFDSAGVCSNCHRFEGIYRRRHIPPSERPARLEALIAALKADGKGKDYDCVIGVSGGVDSTYVAYLTHRWGLRPLAIHFDNGWNSELAVSNIEKTLKRLNIDLSTFVVDWPEFRDLQISFLKASTPDGEVPTDHAIMALLYAGAEILARLRSSLLVCQDKLPKGDASASRANRRQSRPQRGAALRAQPGNPCRDRG